MSYWHDYFWCEVLGRPAQSECPVVYLLGKPEVCDLDVPLGRDQQILRLHIPVRDLVLMEKLEGQDNLSAVEERYIVWEAVLTAKQTEDLTSLHVLKDKIDMSIVFKTFVSNQNKRDKVSGWNIWLFDLQIDYERVQDHRKEALFDLNVLDLFKFDYLGLLQGLDCDDVIFYCCEINFAEGARTDHFDQIEVADAPIGIFHHARNNTFFQIRAPVCPLCLFLTTEEPFVDVIRRVDLLLVLASIVW